MEQWLNRQRTVVTLSGECLATLEHRYAAVGVELRAERFHLAEYLLLWKEPLVELAAGAIAAWEERGGLPKVAYHDSCHLARGSRATQAPQKLLELMLGQPPLPLVHSGASTRCCGATGSFERLHPDIARTMARAVTTDHRARQADWLVSGAPGCATHLGREAEGPEVMDVAGFLTRFTAPLF